MKVSRTDKRVAIISFGGVIGMILLALAGQLGFEYWWPAACIVGPATIAWALWVGREPRQK